MSTFTLNNKSKNEKTRMIFEHTKKNCVQIRVLVSTNHNDDGRRRRSSNNNDENALFLCLQPRMLQMNSDFILQPCDEYQPSQQFRYDEGSGQIQSLLSNESLCLTVQNKNLLLQKCPSSTNNNGSKFALKISFPPQKDKVGNNVYEVLWKQNDKFKISSSLGGSSSSSSSNIILAKSNPKYQQRWVFVPTKQLFPKKTYIPGLLSVHENGLDLSSGLTSRIIARSNEHVKFSNGNVSTTKFHKRPDGAAVFKIEDGINRGGWIYTSNSEVMNGGVGAITFNPKGDVIHYDMILTGTNKNCGGGKTYWNTFVTCEENKPHGQVYEVDPFSGKNSQRKIPTVIGGSGGNYESFAVDNRNRLHPSFYVTNDDSNGSLVRFKPNEVVIATAEKSGNYSNVLYEMGSLEYLQLHPITGSKEDESGTFDWISSRTIADGNAAKFYKNAEGIDVRNGFLYFTTKKSKSLFILDLDNLTYERSSTEHGSFDGRPDQIARIIGSNPKKDLLYFCEESSSSNGVHARNTDGEFYTILSSTLKSETTGLAFSPDNRHMYISLQQKGFIFDITRNDGYPFGAEEINIHHH